MESGSIPNPVAGPSGSFDSDPDESNNYASDRSDPVEASVHVAALDHAVEGLAVPGHAPRHADPVEASVHVAALDYAVEGLAVPDHSSRHADPDAEFSGSRAGRFRIGPWRKRATCSSKFNCRWPIYLVMAILILTPFLLNGCSSDSSTTGAGAAEVGSQGFVAGDGSLTLLDPQDRQPAPEISGVTLAGKDFTLSDHVGEVVVLNVWASWCAPCRAEAPALSSVWNDTKDQGVQFVGLVTRDSPTSARAFAQRFDLGYPHLVDDDGSLQLLFRDTLPPQAIPSTLVLDKQGRVAGRALGEISESSLRGFIEPLLNEDQAG